MLTALLSIQKIFVADAVVDILEAPMNASVLLSQGTLALTCSVRRENVFMEIDGLVTGHDDPVLHARGFAYGAATQTAGVSTIQVTMELREGNNNTRIACLGTDSIGAGGRREDVFSPLVYITILSKLLSFVNGQY